MTTDPAALRAQSLELSEDERAACERIAQGSWTRNLDERIVDEIRAAVESERARAEEAEKALDEIARHQVSCADALYGSAVAKSQGLLGEARNFISVSPGADPRPLLARIDALLAGPAAPPPPSAEQQETPQELQKEIARLTALLAQREPLPERDPGTCRRYSHGSPDLAHWKRDDCVDWIALPCPHARPTWRMCPHCLGIGPGNAADRPPPALSVEQNGPPDGASPGLFTCPRCGASHDRGWVNGTDTYRCLGCGYIGYGFHPDTEVDAEIGKAIRAEQKWQREHGLPEGPFAPDEAAWRVHRERARSAPPALSSAAASAEKREGAQVRCEACWRFDRVNCPVHGIDAPRERASPEAPPSTENTPETPK